MKMKDGSSTNMIMVRNPWGKVFYNAEWSYKDSRWRDSFYKNQVPLGVDPKSSNTKGIFIAPASILKGDVGCFILVNIAHLRDKEGFKHQWYDNDNLAEDNMMQEYTIVPKSSNDDIYVMAEQYYRLTVPYSCTINKAGVPLQIQIKASQKGVGL